MIDRKEKRFQEFAAFLADFVYHLNQMAMEGWAVFVEGKRDEGALRKLGFEGTIVTVSSLTRASRLDGLPSRVIVLTDLDREGSILAARFARRLAHGGSKLSFVERKRLRAASTGAFLHIENLGRFAEEAELRNSLGI